MAGFGSALASTLVVIVHYRSESATRSLVDDLLQQSCGSSLAIYIVDNSAAEGVPLALQPEDPRIRIIRPQCNLGYFAGAAFALEAHLSSAPLPLWVAISNPDIRLADRAFFCNLYDTYSTDAPAVLAPAVLLPNGVDQNPYMVKRPSRRRMQLYKSMFRYFPVTAAYEILSRQKQRARALRRHVSSEFSPNSNKSMSIYAPHGSFILFHRSYFVAGGNFKHGTFLFGEEISVAETVRRLDLQVIYDPRFQVGHDGHVTVGSWPNRAITRHIKDAAAYVANEYFQ